MSEFNDALFYELRDDIKKAYDEFIINKTLVIWGTGSQAERFVSYFEMEPDYYVDNNPLKKGQSFNTKPIFLPERLKDASGNMLILIASMAYPAISKQLEAIGFIERKDFFEIEDFFNHLQEGEALKCAEEEYACNETSYRILFEVTRTLETKSIHGIYRVVSKIMREGYKQSKVQFTAVIKIGDILTEPKKWLMINDIVQYVDECEYTHKKIKYNKNDILVLMDHVWYRDYNNYSTLIKEAKSNGAKVINGLYDLLPITASDMFEEVTVLNFKNMYNSIFQNSDGVVAISKSVANEVIEYIEEKNIVFDRRFEVGWFHLGAEFLENNDIQLHNDNIEKIFINKTFIMVGTIEPRKGHEIALNAFEKLWEMGYDYNLCILGKIGWKMESLIERINNHRELNNRLFFIDAPSDQELAYCYKKASALIFASKAEGFGLPIIEAAQFSLPVILSDIPIFREVAGDNALYFNTFDSNALADAIITWSQLDKKSKAMDSSQIKVQTWSESFAQLIEVIINNNWYKTYSL